MIEAPPPWALTGSGTILLFRFPRDFVESHGCIPAFLTGRYCGGIGAVILVDYHTSPVGPYRETLFIPGLFEYNGQRLFSITSIYVSTMESVNHGQRNWGIPKQLADFQIESHDDLTHFQTYTDNTLALDVRIQRRGPRLPVNTRWFPLRLALVQKEGERILKTAPYGSGKIGFVRLESVHVDGVAFPDFGTFKPLATLHAVDVNLIFPEPEAL